MAKPNRPPQHDLREIRRRILTAVASDDLLVEHLVLKGGNALELIHRIGERASLDLDFSMEEDVAGASEIESRLMRAIKDRLDSMGLVVLDWKFGPRPNTPQEVGARWGGYRGEFKLVTREVIRDHGGDPDAQRRLAVELGPEHQRIFQVDISRFEFCRGNTSVDVDGYELKVRVPAQADHRFRSKPITQSGGSRSPIPEQADR